MALPGRVAGAHLHRAGKEPEEPVVLLQQQRDRVSAPETARGRPRRRRAKPPLLAGPPDRHGGGGVRRRGGCHLHDGQPTQRCDPGLLHVLLLPDATRVCA